MARSRHWGLARKQYWNSVLIREPILCCRKKHSSVVWRDDLAFGCHTTGAGSHMIGWNRDALGSVLVYGYCTKHENHVFRDCGPVSGCRTRHLTRVFQQQHGGEVAGAGEEASLLFRNSVCGAVAGGRMMVQATEREKCTRALVVPVMAREIHSHGLLAVLKRFGCDHGYYWDYSSQSSLNCLLIVEAPGFRPCTSPGSWLWYNVAPWHMPRRACGMSLTFEGCSWDSVCWCSVGDS